jgi:hypothetical protein
MSSIRCERVSPPLGIGPRASVFRKTGTQRTAVAIPIWNCAAAALDDKPPSTAAITRDPRSTESVFPFVLASAPASTMNYMTAASGSPYTTLDERPCSSSPFHP